MNVMRRQRAERAGTTPGGRYPGAAYFSSSRTAGAVQVIH